MKPRLSSAAAIGYVSVRLEIVCSENGERETVLFHNLTKTGTVRSDIFKVKKFINGTDRRHRNARRNSNWIKTIVWRSLAKSSPISLAKSDRYEAPTDTATESARSQTRQLAPALATEDSAYFVSISISILKGTPDGMDVPSSQPHWFFHWSC